MAQVRQLSPLLTTIAGIQSLAYNTAVSMAWITSEAAPIAQGSDYRWLPKLHEYLQNNYQNFCDTNALLNGLLKYYSAPSSICSSTQYQAERDQRTVFRCGAGRLMQYPPRVPDSLDHLRAPWILLLPSLINRSYILDLRPDAYSLVQYLTQQGIGVLLWDWGELSPTEHSFDLNAYWGQRLQPALEYALTHYPRLAVGGYCLGGLFALAAAQLYPGHINRLVLIATPWDFAGFPLLNPIAPRVWQQSLHYLLQHFGYIPGPLLHSWIQYLHLPQILNKFINLGMGEPEQSEHHAHREQLQHFAILEDWANDCSDLAAGVAQEIGVNFYLHNSPLRNQWQLGGVSVTPQAIRIPTLLIYGHKDSICPPPAALALGERLGPQYCRLVAASSGHVGLIAGNRARHTTWPAIASHLK